MRATAHAAELAEKAVQPKTSTVEGMGPPATVQASCNRCCCAQPQRPARGRPGSWAHIGNTWSIAKAAQLSLGQAPPRWCMVVVMNSCASRMLADTHTHEHGAPSLASLGNGTHNTERTQRVKGPCNTDSERAPRRHGYTVCCLLFGTVGSGSQGPPVRAKLRTRGRCRLGSSKGVESVVGVLGW